MTSPRFRLWLRERTGASASQIPERVVRVADDRLLQIGPDPIYWSIHHGLDFEPTVTTVIRRLVRPGDTIVDAGANFGWFTTLFGALVEEAGHVYGFEPVPTTHKTLVSNIERNQLTARITVERAALGAEPGEANVHVFADLSHGRSSLSKQDQQVRQSFLTPVNRLDDYLDSRGVDAIDLIKIDVEGSEQGVLQGARERLRAETAPIVVMELNDEACRSMGYPCAALIDLLSGFGYDQFYRFAGADQLLPIEPKNAHGEEMIVACKGKAVERRIATSTAMVA